MSYNPSRFIIPIILLICVFMTGCSNPQIFSDVQTHTNSLKAGDLEQYGVAFITPSTTTGHEQDKQALALTFAEVLVELKPDISVVSLSETIGNINSQNLAEQYKKMYADYIDTGIFNRDILKQVSIATRARFLIQLKLASFQQGTRGRWSLLGIRLLDTKFANIRIFLQVWDTQTGSISWEGTQEYNYSSESFADKPINFSFVVEQTARTLIGGLP